MAEKAKKTKAEGRKNLLYILWVIALVAIMAAAIAVVTAVSTRDNVLEKPDDTGSSVGDSGSEQNPGDSGTPDDDKPDDDKPDEGSGTVDGKINFIMPVASSRLIKGYTDNTIVYSNTLGLYTGHMGMDFGAEAGTNVLCVGDGKIESVTTNYLTGTTVVVDHGGNLKTVYNSIEASEALFEGASVKQGDVLGTVSDNNRQEYKDGPHLHFEVLKSGAKTDPEEFLIGNEK